MKTWSEIEDITGNSKTASIDLFPGHLIGCISTTANVASTSINISTATAPFMQKYHSNTIQHNSKVAEYQSTKELSSLGMPPATKSAVFF